MPESITSSRRSETTISGVPEQRSDTASRKLTLLTLLAALVLLIAGFVMRLYTLGVPFDRDSYDEGVYWQTLRAMSAGHQLYQSVFYSQPPAFLLTIFPIYTVFGQSIWSARLGIVLLSLLGLLGIALLGKALAGRAGLLIGLLLLLSSPLYLAESQILQADAPSTALSLLAVGLAYLWWETPQGLPGIAYAVFSGVALTVGILCKLLPTAVAPIGLLALAQLWRIMQQPRAERWPYAHSLLAGGAAIVLTTLIALAPYAGTWNSFWQMVVTFHLAAKVQFLATQSLNKGLILQFLKAPLTALALLGMLVALLRRDWRVLPLLSWLLLTLYLLWQQVPLFAHHLVALVPPLVGLAIMVVGPFKFRLISISRVATIAGVVLALLVVGAGSLTAWHNEANVLKESSGVSTRANLAVARELQRVTQPDQLVITDAQFIAALAQRSTPDSLVDTSSVRIQTGYVTSAQLIYAAEQPQVVAVLFYTSRLKMVAGFHLWVSQHFYLVQNYGNGQELWCKIKGETSLQVDAHSNIYKK